MYNILTLNKISSTGIKNFTSDYKCADDIKSPFDAACPDRFPDCP